MLLAQPHADHTHTHTHTLWLQVEDEQGGGREARENTRGVMLLKT